MSALGNKKIMSKNIQYYVLRSGKERNEICKDLNVSYSTFTDWYNGNTYPRIDRIEQMADYFGCTKADLVEDRDHENHEEFYSDATVQRIADSLKEHAGFRVLFDAAANISPEDIPFAAEFLKRIKREGDD